MAAAATTSSHVHYAKHLPEALLKTFCGVEGVFKNLPSDEFSFSKTSSFPYVLLTVMGKVGSVTQTCTLRFSQGFVTKYSLKETQGSGAHQKITKFVDLTVKAHERVARTREVVQELIATLKAE